MRKEFWGYAADETLDNDALIAERYRGIRPAPGYPACPEHSEKRVLFDLLDVTGKTGIELTDHFAMYPAASVSGLYFSHPDSKYFVVGRVTKEQVADYARRKGVDIAQAERWLSFNLDYDPEWVREKRGQSRLSKSDSTLAMYLGQVDSNRTPLPFSCHQTRSSGTWYMGSA